MDAPREALVEAHLGYADAVARGIFASWRRVLSHSAMDLDDVHGAAYRGLVIAAKRFDPARGVPFRKYAFLVVRSYVLIEIRKMSGGSKLRDGVVRQFACHTLRHAEFDVAELDRYASASPDVADEACEALDGAALSERVSLALDLLSSKERAVITSHYFREETLHKIAQKMGRSPQRVSQIHASAVNKLRAVFAA